MELDRVFVEKESYFLKFFNLNYVGNVFRGYWRNSNEKKIRMNYGSNFDVKR